MSKAHVSSLQGVLCLHTLMYTRSNSTTLWIWIRSQAVAPNAWIHKRPLSLRSAGGSATQLGARRLWRWENSQEESWIQLVGQGETSQGKLEMECYYLLMQWWPESRRGDVSVWFGCWTDELEEERKLGCVSKLMLLSVVGFVSKMAK